MSIPDDAVTSGVSVSVVDGSTIARRGRSAALPMPVLTFRRQDVDHADRVLSLPVPAVVGRAISGFRGFVGARPSPIGGFRYVKTVPSFVESRFIALAVSMTEPPPTATNPSTPAWRAQAAATSTEASVGSTWTSANGRLARPPRSANARRARRGRSPARPWSVTIATRRSPSAATSEPTSSIAPAPNLIGGAPHVKTVSGRRW